jgi:surface protein
MFSSCNALTTLNMDSWDVSNVTDMSNMFRNCKALTTLNIASWDVSSVTDMSYMFAICNKLTTLDLSAWDVASVTNMSNMFASCYVLTPLDLSGWNVASVTNMSNMFQSCKALTTLDLSAWDVANVTNMSGMFSSCTALTALNMGGSALNPNVNVGSFMAGASTTGVFTYKNIFDYSPIINVLPANWTVTAVAAREITFYVGDNEFVAREGMTWYDWCNSGEFSTEGGGNWSSYNIGCNGADDVVYWEDTSGFGGGGDGTISIGGVPVYGRDIIVENGQYNR